MAATRRAHPDEDERERVVLATATQKRTQEELARSKSPQMHVKAMCKFNPCRRPGCYYRHADGQHVPFFAEAKSRPKADQTKPSEAPTRNECAICLVPMELSTTEIGVFTSCGHCACRPCAEAVVRQQGRCPIVQFKQ